MIGDLIMEVVIYPVTDWFAWVVFNLGLGFSKGLIAFGSFLKVALPMFIFGKCLQVLFSDKRKKYHWSKLQKAPKKYFDHLSQDKDIKVFLKGLLFFMGLLLFTVAVLKSFTILIPDEDGLHILDMLTAHNFSKIFQLFSTVTVLLAAFKITQYRALGIINSYKDFKLKMIFWM
ncbi:hypothetical protein [Marinoscillum sp.]|uniref:hypothetical protein n=1 Tax=Marinoscillum sp. TaxID=2024838 RepID=UPI003BA88122